MSDTIPYTRETRIPRLLEFKNYLVFVISSIYEYIIQLK